MTHIDDIKKVLKTGKVFVGAKEVLKNLKLGKISKIYVSATVAADLKNSVKKYASMINVEVIELKYANDEFGALCKKPYAISILGFIK